MIKTTTGETMSWAGSWIAAGVPVDLTGYTLTAEVRPQASTDVESVACALADQITDPGEYTVDITSLALGVGVYFLRIRYVEPGGDIHRSTPVRLEVDLP